MNTIAHADCALAKYLEKVSSSGESGSRVLHAAVLLYCLRYRTPGSEDGDMDIVRETLKLLDEEHHQTFLAEIAGLCRACRADGGCAARGTILAPAAFPA